jgi:hypothetical protein
VVMAATALPWAQILVLQPVAMPELVVTVVLEAIRQVELVVLVALVELRARLEMVERAPRVVSAEMRAPVAPAAPVALGVTVRPVLVVRAVTLLRVQMAALLGWRRSVPLRVVTGAMVPMAVTAVSVVPVALVKQMAMEAWAVTPALQAMALQDRLQVSLSILAAMVVTAGILEQLEPVARRVLVWVQPEQAAQQALLSLLAAMAGVVVRALVMPRV